MMQAMFSEPVETIGKILEPTSQKNIIDRCRQEWLECWNVWKVKCWDVGVVSCSDTLRALRT